MDRRIKLGILTPSSNTSLEPLSQAIVAGLPSVSVHFSRFAVVKIGLGSDALDQFRPDRILAAARLLADAEVDAIGWSGTSSGWLGFDNDEALCRAITDATGIPATTSVLALNAALELFGVTNLGLVTPYTDDVQRRIVDNYGAAGVDCTSERHAGLSKNSSFAAIGEPALDAMVAAVAAGEVQAVTTFCTNLQAAQRVAHWEREHGIPVFDTVLTVIWDMLRQLGVDTTPLAESWGVLCAKS